MQQTDPKEREWVTFKFCTSDYDKQFMQVIQFAAVLNWFDYEYLNAVLSFNLTSDSLYHNLISNSKDCDIIYLKQVQTWKDNFIQIETIESESRIFSYAMESGFLTKKNRKVVEQVIDYVRKYYQSRV